jgi:hypothetical protein
MQDSAKSLANRLAPKEIQVIAVATMGVCVKPDTICDVLRERLTNDPRLGYFMDRTGVDERLLLQNLATFSIAEVVALSDIIKQLNSLPVAQSMRRKLRPILAALRRRGMAAPTGRLPWGACVVIADYRHCEEILLWHNPAALPECREWASIAQLARWLIMTICEFRTEYTRWDPDELKLAAAYLIARQIGWRNIRIDQVDEDVIIEEFPVARLERHYNNGILRAVTPAGANVPDPTRRDD